jgi:hypothetical protein
VTDAALGSEPGLAFDDGAHQFVRVQAAFINISALPSRTSLTASSAEAPRAKLLIRNGECGRNRTRVKT